jgi:hypothetical protein
MFSKTYIIEVFNFAEINLIVKHYYYYLIELQMGFYPVAVVLQ